MTLPLPAVRPPTTDTEERLLDHSLTLFAEKGYEAASVREIIEATGVTRPVLYYYCSSKEDLLPIAYGQSCGGRLSFVLLTLVCLG
jgi:AcrR family transcriptional regulator